MREKEEEEEENRNDQLKKGYHFLLCLRPAVMENLGTPGSNGSPFKHLRMESLDGSHRILPPPDNSPAAAAGHFKKKSRRKFVRLIKAVLFETSLANKIRKKAKKKKQSSIGDSPSLKMEKKDDTYPVMATTLNKKFGKKNTAKIISATPSIETSSILSSSSCASSVASSSMRFPESDLIEQKEKKNEQEKGKGYYGINNNGLFFILVALLVLVIWGKLFAILCTSAWLFFVPNWSKGKRLLLLKSRVNKSDESSSSSSVDNKEEYNKKIIMEGLLDRKRS